MPTRANVAIVIVGSEVLSGRVVDKNAEWLAKELHSCGACLTEVSVLPDNVDIIAERVRTLSSANDFVITAGGIGT